MTVPDDITLQFLTLGAIGLTVGAATAVIAWRAAALMDRRLAVVPKVRLRIVTLRACAVLALVCGVLVAGAMSFHALLSMMPSVAALSLMQEYLGVMNWPANGLFVAMALAVLTIGDWAKPTFRSFAAGWWVEARLRVLRRRLKGQTP